MKELSEKQSGQLTLEQVDDLARDMDITSLEQTTETNYDKTLVDLQRRDQIG